MTTAAIAQAETRCAPLALVYLIGHSMCLFSLLSFYSGSEDVVWAVAFGAVAPLRMLQPDEPIFPDLSL
jgi:hypothetical protein